MNTVKEYAPVAVFVYSRSDKTKAMFESLRLNPEAKESRIYIFSDAPKNEQALYGVKEVREYIDLVKTKDWFGEVNIVKAKVNKGLAGSIIAGVTELLDKYGRIIVLEDDLIVSKNYLRYMNQCLEFYAGDKRIWSIDGYSHNPKCPKGYMKDVFLSYRASSWGWGTWKDRWELIDWEVKDYGRFRFDPVANLRFRRGGNDLPSMLKAQMKGKIDSWAVRWCYSQSKLGKFSVAPLRTLVGNYGLDGSGTNCKDIENDSRREVKIDEEIRQWTVKDLSVNRQLIKDFYRRHYLSPYIRIRDKFKELKG